MSAEDPITSPTPEPTNVPGRAEMPVDGRSGADVASGSNHYISWGARSDVGLVRSHNEDSFLLRTPLFAVCDGMGGHAAGEVASSIAVETIAATAPNNADDALLGAAIESANLAVIKGAEDGRGKPGMGCTASAVLIDGNRMAVAHVGDSRVYLLHHGTLVRVTRDHSYVEELVDAGQITADEARTHPSRSIITRALGSDPDMYADHFTLEVVNGDRVIVCSDGLSSMVPDSDIEALATSSATPQQAADNLVSAALTAGGADNVTVVVVDVLNDGVADATRQRLLRRAVHNFAVVAIVVVAVFALVLFIARTGWYLAPNGDTVGIYEGSPSDFNGIDASELVETTTVEVTDLPAAVQDQLSRGIVMNSEQEAHETVESYRDQIDADKAKAGQTAEEVKAEAGDTATEPTGAEGEAAAATDGTTTDGTAADGTTDATTTTEGGNQ